MTATVYRCIVTASGPKFEKIAEASLKLDDVSASVSTYDLTIHDANAADKGSVMSLQHLHVHEYEIMTSQPEYDYMVIA